MKIKKLEADLLYNKDIHLTIIASDGDFNSIHRLSQLSEEEIQKYDLRIEKKRKKRSLDSNAYLWVLCDKIAKELNSTSEEIYQDIIQRYGVSEIIPIKAEACKAFMQKWCSQGLGNIADDLGACRNTPGYRNIKIYFGSSTYNSKEMSVLIDGIVYEAKELGIETMTPEEIEKLKAAWRSNEQS